jgi:hypothetical protein
VLLDDGNAASPVEFDLDLHPLPRVDRLSGVGTGCATQDCATNGGGGPARTTPDPIAQQATSRRPDKGASGAASFNLDHPNRGHDSGPNLLGPTCFASRVSVSRQGILGARGEHQRYGGNDKNPFHNAKIVPRSVL